MEQNKTDWRKNIDTNYISGEDLKHSIKGLKPEMVVVIDKFEDSQTFDQNKQEKITKTGLFLRELNGSPLYKPMILNKTNSLACVKEFGSNFMEDWIGKPIVLYAKPDNRFGHVARFKKYYPSSAIDDVQAIATLNASTSKADLQIAWNSLSTDEKNLPSIIAVKDKLKVSLP